MAKVTKKQTLQVSARRYLLQRGNKKPIAGASSTNVCRARLLAQNLV